MDKDEDEKETSPKTEDKWSIDECKSDKCHFHSNGCKPGQKNIFQDAWSILETTYEGTAAVKISKLHILATRFEDLKMKEDDTINDFNTKLCDIANEVFTLGEKTRMLNSFEKRYANFQAVWM